VVIDTVAEQIKCIPLRYKWLSTTLLKLCLKTGLVNFIAQSKFRILADYASKT